MFSLHAYTFNYIVLPVSEIVKVAIHNVQSHFYGEW